MSHHKSELICWHTIIIILTLAVLQLINFQIRTFLNKVRQHLNINLKISSITTTAIQIKSVT